MGESRGIKAETISPLEYLDKLCDYALHIGMPYDLYWNGRPSALLNYINKVELDLQKVNYQMWLQGLYIYQAIGELVPILNPFSKEHRAKPYLKEPIPITQKELEEQEARKVQRLKDFLMSKVKGV